MISLKRNVAYIYARTYAYAKRAIIYLGSLIEKTVKSAIIMNQR